MSNYHSKTIKEAIRDINARKMYLPSIQRNFVWSNDQITNLMDSIMRDYPIGTFLFWEVDKRTINESEYTLYEFIRDYHERDACFNEKGPSIYIPENDKTAETDTITAVLDGQQRLTALYLALQGTITRRSPYARKTSRNAYIIKELYLNLYSDYTLSHDDIDDESVIFEFKFMTKEEVHRNNDEFWFKVKDILKYSKDGIDDLADDLIESIESCDDPKTKRKHIRNILSKLHNRLTESKIINYFNARADHEQHKFTTLDEVTDIFVRINSGGTKLSKSDLLFSRIVSVWNDARENIQELVKRLNRNHKYKFDSDFIVKACLMAIGCSSKIKADSLKKTNIETIRSEWSNIQNAIEYIRNFLESIGIIHESILSYNAILPLILYRYRFGSDEITEASKLAMKKYIVVAQVEQIFGKSSNAVLDKIQNQFFAMPQNSEFPDIHSIRLLNDNTVSLDRAMIRRWFDREKGPETFAILTLLYPGCQFANVSFEQDHMHPFSSFDTITNTNTIKNVFEIDESGAQIELTGKAKNEFLKTQRNQLANLQLLESGVNNHKRISPLADWLKTHREQAKYLPDCSYELCDFEDFMTKRQQIMEDALCRFFELAD